MEKRLNEEHYKQLLLNRFEDPDMKFVKADLKPLSKNTEGFMGVYFNLKLIYTKDNIEHSENFFIKTKPFDVAEDHPSVSEHIYDKEIFFYGVLFKEFEKLGFDTSFSPKCYLTVKDDTLIMEDMMEKDFHLPERQTYYDVSKVKSLLKSLAMLHASGFAYEKTKSSELGKTYNIVKENPLALKETLFTQFTTGKGFGVQFFQSCISNFKVVIDQLPKDETYKTKFKQLLDDAEFGKIFVEDHGLKKTCVHGDLWSNNMMFRYSGTTAEACCLVDYQVGRYFYPGFDVLLATHFNTDEEFCKNHLEAMYQYYYDTLAEIIKTYGYSVEEFMTLEDFRKSLKIFKTDAMLQVASVNSTVFVPADFMEKFTKGFTSAENMEKLMKDITKKFCPSAFNNDEIYRKTMTKHLYDLYDALEEKYCKN